MACIPCNVVLLPSVVHREFRCAAPTPQQRRKERLTFTSRGQRSGSELEIAADRSLDALVPFPVDVTLVGAGDEGEPLFARLAPGVRAFNTRFVAGAVLGLALRMRSAVSGVG